MDSCCGVLLIKSLKLPIMVIDLEAMSQFVWLLFKSGW